MKRSDGSEVFVLGITGGIGAGKSTVTKILEELGVSVIDCDKIAHGLTDENYVLKKLASEFGNEIIDESGKLKRKELGRIVFSNKDKLGILNSIMHNLIEEDILKRINALTAGDFCIIDAAIPFKRGFIDVSDEIWVVTSDEKRRVERIRQRDKLTNDDIRNRMTSQIGSDEYLGLADVVIVNDGDISQLRENVIMNFNQFKLSRGQ